MCAHGASEVSARSTATAANQTEVNQGAIRMKDGAFAWTTWSAWLDSLDVKLPFQFLAIRQR